MREFLFTDDFARFRASNGRPGIFRFTNFCPVLGLWIIERGDFLAERILLNLYIVIGIWLGILRARGEWRRIFLG